jgi:hypothetical protein
MFGNELTKIGSVQMSIVETLAAQQLCADSENFTEEKKKQLIRRVQLGCSRMPDAELCECAVFLYNIFLRMTHLLDFECAQNAMVAFKEILSRGYEDAIIYEYYILLLEFTYQYSESFELLMQLYHVPRLKVTSLKYLSQYAYLSNGFISAECHKIFEEEYAKYKD